MVDLINIIYNSNNYTIFLRNINKFGDMMRKILKRLNKNCYEIENISLYFKINDDITKIIKENNNYFIKNGNKYYSNLGEQISLNIGLDDYLIKSFNFDYIYIEDRLKDENNNIINKSNVLANSYNNYLICKEDEVYAKIMLK